MSLTKDELDAILRIAGIPTADEDREASRGQAYELGRADAVYSQARVMAEKVDGQVTAIREYAEGLESKLNRMLGWLGLDWFDDGSAELPALKEDGWLNRQAKLHARLENRLETVRDNAYTRIEALEKLSRIYDGVADTLPAPHEPAAPKCETKTADGNFSHKDALEAVETWLKTAPLSTGIGTIEEIVSRALHPFTPAPAPSESGERCESCGQQAEGYTADEVRLCRKCANGLTAPAGEAGKASEARRWDLHVGDDGEVYSHKEGRCQEFPRVNVIELTPEVEAALINRSFDAVAEARFNEIREQARADRAAVERVEKLIWKWHNVSGPSPWHRGEVERALRGDPAGTGKP